MLNNYTINPLFSSPVIKMNIEENTDELKYAKSVKEYSNMRILENHPKINDILLYKFKIIAEEALGYHEKEYFITTSWITATTKGERSHQHNHRNSFWSGVYYFQDEYPKGTAPIQFANPTAQMWDVFYRSPDLKNPNEISSSYWNVYPQPKQLLFFPSYLKHGIMLHEIDNVRRSLAFNIMPLGVWGDLDSTYDSNWTLKKSQLSKGYKRTVHYK